MSRAAVYLPDGTPGPGRVHEVELDLVDRDANQLVLPGLTVRDEGDAPLLEGADLRFRPAAGGGPQATAEDRRQARAFGLVNAAFHAQRALRFANELLERPLPPLLVRIGAHRDQRCWGGGHYRLPARAYSELPESGPVRPSGEIHLGYGRRTLPTPAPGYFNAPAHNAAIVVHEVGHHICRHTADFRLNRLLPPEDQANRKIPLDEGTCDYLTAVLTGTADIFAWHRSHVAPWQQRRRKLDSRWTMAHFHGGRDRDPHTDGTVWASALWSARYEIRRAGIAPERFDAMLLGGLELHGRRAPPERSEEVLRRHRFVADVLSSMLEVDPSLAAPVLAAMEKHGIRPGQSNASLRDAARAPLVSDRAA